MNKINRKIAICINCLFLNVFSEKTGKTIDPGNAEYQITANNIPVEGQSIEFRLVTGWGTIQDLINISPTNFTISLINGTVISNEIQAIINLSQSKSRGTILLTFNVENNSTVSGTFSGDLNKKKVSGKINGKIIAPFDPYTKTKDAMLKILTASYFGSSEDDDLYGACNGPDGTIFIAGNTGSSMMDKFKDVCVNKFGEDEKDPKCKSGFIAQLDKEGKKVLRYCEFGKGIVTVTTIEFNGSEVYVAGYASEALENLLKDVPGIIRKYPLYRQVKLLEEGKWLEAVGEDPTKPDPISEKAHGQLGRRGAPFVLKISKDLNRILSGTYLEGWQQVWGKNRTVPGKPGPDWPEYYWYGTHIAILKSGDVLVCHDGGYFRILTEEDEIFVTNTVERLIQEKWLPANNMERQKAEKMSDDEKRAYYRSKLRQILGFYNVPDYLSRLSHDLDKRIYIVPVYTPATDPQVAGKLKYGWPYAYYSNTRTHRMFIDKDEKLYIAGWSATQTSQEPWWAGFLLQIDPSNGQVIRKIFERDPMGGKDNRMGGAVADRGIACVTTGDDGTVYYNSYSDGGWSGVIHFSGSIIKWTPGTNEGKGIFRTGPCCWVTDMAVLPNNKLLAAGRENLMKGWSDDAWQKGCNINPEAWVAVFKDKGDYADRLYFSAILGVWPNKLLCISNTKFLIVGTSWGTINKPFIGPDLSIKGIKETNPGVAIVKDAIFPIQQGKADGYFIIFELNEGKNL